MQNGLIWKSVRAVFAKPNVGEEFTGFAGAKTHENAMFLYKSHQAEYFVKHRSIDFLCLTALIGFVGGFSPFLFLPVFWTMTKVPRYLAEVHYFTFHAELLPHTEQVVFHKVKLYGGIEKHFVNINSLEKVDVDHVKSSIFWNVNMFEKQMLFRCSETQEVFVFDRNGVWNKEALNHPLLN